MSASCGDGVCRLLARVAVRTKRKETAIERPGTEGRCQEQIVRPLVLDLALRTPERAVQSRAVDCDRFGKGDGPLGVVALRGSYSAGRPRPSIDAHAPQLSPTECSACSVLCIRRASITLLRDRSALLSLQRRLQPPTVVRAKLKKRAETRRDNIAGKTEYLSGSFVLFRFVWVCATCL